MLRKIFNFLDEKVQSNKNTFLTEQKKYEYLAKKKIISFKNREGDTDRKLIV